MIGLKSWAEVSARLLAPITVAYFLYGVPFISKAHSALLLTRYEFHLKISSFVRFYCFIISPSLLFDNEEIMLLSQHGYL